MGVDTTIGGASYHDESHSNNKSNNSPNNASGYNQQSNTQPGDKAYGSGAGDNTGNF